MNHQGHVSPNSNFQPRWHQRLTLIALTVFKRLQENPRGFWKNTSKFPSFFGGHPKKKNFPNTKFPPKSWKKMTFQPPTSLHISAATLSHKDLALSFTVLLIGTKKRMGEVLRSPVQQEQVVLVASNLDLPTKNQPQLEIEGRKSASPLIAEFYSGNPSNNLDCLSIISTLRFQIKIRSKLIQTIFLAKLLGQILQKPPPFHLSWALEYVQRKLIGEPYSWNQMVIIFWDSCRHLAEPKIMYMYAHFLWQSYILDCLYSHTLTNVWFFQKVIV